MTIDLFSLKGKTAIITGGGSGIGQAISLALVSVGCEILIVGRNIDKLKTTKKLIYNKYNVEIYYIQSDLTQLDKIPYLAKTILSKLKKVNILVNCAGINPRKHDNDMTIEEWNYTLKLNTSAPFFLSRELVRDMKKNGFGRIINIGSLQTKLAFENGTNYGTSKGGLCQLTKAMAKSWSKFGINVNMVSPGFFETDLTKQISNTEEWVRCAQKTAICRNGLLKDIYGIVIFLSSEASNYITAQNIFVDGGFNAMG